jgi:hypothetical protein
MKSVLFPVVYVFNWGLISETSLTSDERGALVEAYCECVHDELERRGIITEVRWDEIKSASQSLPSAVRDALDDVERDDAALRAAADAVFGG